MVPMHVASWCITGASLLGIILRPWRLPEATWAVLGAVLLVVCSLLPLASAGAAVLRGTDVYLFLIGMMLLAELAQQEGVFDWMAAYAVQHAAGSRRRLFLLVYAVGTLVTVLMSNDATAVVLTPAVCAAVRHARIPALPYLLVCAFIANAASFVLPIANPANLVVFGRDLPSLLPWLRGFAVASMASILITFWMLRVDQRRALSGSFRAAGRPQPLTAAGRLTVVAIGLMAIVLLASSGLGWPLGLPAFAAGTGAWLVVSLLARRSPLPLLRHVSWGVLPLVAGLFVLVAGVQRTEVLDPVARWLVGHAGPMPTVTALLSGTIAGLASNAVNNLPMGLMAGSLAAGAHLPAPVTGALLIGVDLGPNLSVTGSLATILWLVAIRRDGHEVSALQFLRIGCFVMPVTLIVTLLVYVATAASGA